MADVGPLDRELQRALLLEMQASYPNSVSGFSDQVGSIGGITANLFYLREHGLCGFTPSEGVDGRLRWSSAKITARGLDFLADDGGLSAILGVVTVKLHADTIRDLIEAKIKKSGLPEEKKTGLRATVARLPETVLQEGSKRLMGLGIDHVGDIETWLHHLPGWLGL